MLSPRFPASRLLYAGTTWLRERVYNVPERDETWRALSMLCVSILEPASDELGEITVTYGFASAALTRKIRGGISPAIDQHAGHELKADGLPICARLGQAVDFYIRGVPASRVAKWIADHTPFDRLYYYGEGRPVHVSVGPQECRSITVMIPNASGRRVPRRVSSDQLIAL
jgi:hypothetical protein